MVSIREAKHKSGSSLIETSKPRSHKKSHFFSCSSRKKTAQKCGDRK